MSEHPIREMLKVVAIGVLVFWAFASVMVFLGGGC